MSDVVEAGLIRVRHVGRTISGGPEMNEENVKIAVHALRRISKAKAKARRIAAAEVARARRAKIAR